MVLWPELEPQEARVKVNRNTLRIRYFAAFSTVNRPPSRIRVRNELADRARADFSGKTHGDPCSGLSAGARH
jgi:hypothetical protein